MCVSDGCPCFEKGTICPEEVSDAATNAISRSVTVPSDHKFLVVETWLLDWELRACSIGMAWSRGYLVNHLWCCLIQFDVAKTPSWLFDGSQPQQRVWRSLRRGEKNSYRQALTLANLDMASCFLLSCYGTHFRCTRAHPLLVSNSVTTTELDSRSRMQIFFCACIYDEHVEVCWRLVPHEMEWLEGAGSVTLMSNIHFATMHTLCSPSMHFALVVCLFRLPSVLSYHFVCICWPPPINVNFPGLPWRVPYLPTVC